MLDTESPSLSRPHATCTQGAARALRGSWRAAGLSLVVLLAASRAGHAQVAVVVHPSSAESNLSKDKLRRLFLGQTTTFPSGKHARLATHVPSAEQFNRTLLGLPSEIVRSRWLAMAFRGEAITHPIEFVNTEDVMRFVREHPDAVAYVPLARVDASVKVLRIDGRRPGDAGYVLR